MTDMETENLIKTLSDGSVPVVRLAQPARRMIVWFMGALIYGAMVAFFMGLRDDLPMRIAEPRFVIELAAALLTSMMAAAAAFCAGCPGRPLWERFAPLPFLGLWLATLGQGCWQDWLWLGAEGLRIGSDFIHRRDFGIARGGDAPHDPLRGAPRTNFDGRTGRSCLGRNGRDRAAFDALAWCQRHGPNLAVRLDAAVDRGSRPFWSSTPALAAAWSSCLTQSTQHRVATAL